jgi:DNA mismatch repair protein MutL
LSHDALVHGALVQGAAAGSPRAEWLRHFPENAEAGRPAAGTASFAEAAPTVSAELHSRAPLVESAGDSLRRLGELRPLGQIKDSFIVAAGPDGLWIIDQHVAHERILFERVLRQRNRGEIESQRLLIPIILNLKPDQEIVFAQIEQEFRANGFDIEPFGRRTIAVKACPAGLSPREVEALVQEILDTPEKELRELSLGDLHRRVAATIACHAAIKVNTTLDADKMQWLLAELAKTECPMSCPHGRPIALKYSLREILKAFHRI